MKKCPYCAEDIQDEAIVCKHCDRELDPVAVHMVSSELSSTEVPTDKSDHRIKVQETSRGLAPETDVLPDAQQEPTEAVRPIWKSATRAGFIFAGVYLVSLIAQVSQNRMGSDEFGGSLVFGTTTLFLLGFLYGYLFVALWRWKTWAPFVILGAVPCMIFLLLLTDFTVTPDAIDVIRDRLGFFESSQPPTVRPIIPTVTRSPRQTEKPSATSARPTAVKQLPKGLILGKPIDLNGQESGKEFWTLGERPELELSVTRGASRTVFKAEFISDDTSEHSTMRQFFCDVAILIGLQCDYGIDLMEQALKGGVVSVGELDMRSYSDRWNFPPFGPNMKWEYTTRIVLTLDE